MLLTKGKIIITVLFLVLFAGFLCCAVYWNELKIKYYLYRISRTESEETAREHMKKIEEIGVAALPILWDYFISDDRAVRFADFSFPLYFIESACILRATEDESLRSKNDLADEYIPKILQSRAAQERIVAMLISPDIDFNLRHMIWRAFRSSEYGIPRYAEGVPAPDMPSENNENVRAFWFLIQWRTDPIAFRDAVTTKENRASEVIREVATYISYNGPPKPEGRIFDAGVKTFEDYVRSHPGLYYPGGY
jgi:hypothetical protein